MGFTAVYPNLAVKVGWLGSAASSSRSQALRRAAVNAKELPELLPHAQAVLDRGIA